jgi:hypothetical protein
VRRLAPALDLLSQQDDEQALEREVGSWTNHEFEAVAY